MLPIGSKSLAHFSNDRLIGVIPGIDPVIPLLSMYATKNETLCLHRGLYMKIHSTSSVIAPKQKSKLLSIVQTINKLWYIYIMKYLFSNKEKLIIDTYNMNKHQNYAEWKKPDEKEHTI